MLMRYRFNNWLFKVVFSFPPIHHQNQVLHAQSLPSPLIRPLLTKKPRTRVRFRKRHGQRYSHALAGGAVGSTGSSTSFLGAANELFHFADAVLGIFRSTHFRSATGFAINHQPHLAGNAIWKRVSQEATAAPVRQRILLRDAVIWTFAG